MSQDCPDCNETRPAAAVATSLPLPVASLLAAQAEALISALVPFALAYRPEAERFLSNPPDASFQAFLDRNTITPTVSMGDFRRAYEVIEALRAASQVSNEQLDADWNAARALSVKEFLSPALAHRYFARIVLGLPQERP